jgi:hypothetical protein
MMSVSQQLSLATTKKASVSTAAVIICFVVILLHGVQQKDTGQFPAILKMMVSMFVS